ncbi:MAG: hypothetical protein ABSA84_06035, partial [Gammaproteobacteria bacterium]
STTTTEKPQASWFKSILDFPADLLFGSKVSADDTLQQSQEQPLHFLPLYSTRNNHSQSNSLDCLYGLSSRKTPEDRVVEEYFSVPENFIYAHSMIGKEQNWKPMFFSDFGNNRKLTPFEGRGGETRYRNVETGTFSKSPLDLVKKDLSKLDVYSKYNLMLNKQDYYYGGYQDLTNRYSAFGFDDAVGVRYYNFGQFNTQLLVNKQGLQPSLNVRWQQGINLASFEKTNSVGTGRVEASGLNVNANITAKANLGPGIVDVYVGGSAVASLVGLQSKVDFNEYCIDKFCVSPSVMQEMYVGSAVRGELGLQYSSITKKGILVLSGGGGLGLSTIPKLNLNFRLREPTSTDNTDNNYISVNSRPAL